MKPADEVWAKWLDWLEDIRVQINEMHFHRMIWQELVRLVEDGGHPHREEFLAPFTRMYVDAQAIAVRRQADADKESVSLRRLLTGLENQSGVVTRERFFGMWLEGIDTRTERGDMENRHLSKKAEGCWVRFIDHKKPKKLDPAVPQKDLKRLEDIAIVVEFATKKVAHSDARPPANDPTFGDLDRAIDLLGELYRTYSLLLTASTPSKEALVPTPQGDWLGPFRKALL